MMPNLIVMASSPACLSLAGQMLGIDAIDLPHRGFSAWRAGCGSPPFTAEIDNSLAAMAWPEVLAVHATTAVDMLEVLSRVWSDARFLFLVQDPEISLATDLPRPAAVDLDTWCNRQIAVTLQMARHLQCLPARSLCLLADELPAAQEAAVALVRAHLGVSLDIPPGRLTLQHPSVLSRALARMLLEPEHRLRSATAELLDTCAPLAAAMRASDHDPLDRAQVVSEWNALAGSGRQRADPALQQTGLRGEVDAAQAEAAPPGTAGRPAPVSDDDADLLREKELLLVHLHQAQEELEQVFLERQSLAHRSGGSGSMSFGTCEIEHARDTPPHLELELLLRDVQCGDQPAFDQLRLRLVEHNGNPGIVLFSDLRLPRQFLGSWMETGREGGFPYMLIVPSDTAGKALLRRLPTSDWRALLRLANDLAGQLSALSTTECSAWPAVARQLACQLAEQPPRLRYDQLDVEADERGYRIRFGNPTFGERRFPQLLLRWRQDDALPLALLAPDEEAVPAALDRWPRAGDGRRAGSFALPVGRLGPWARWKHWARLTPMDSGLLLGLLDALPAVIQAARTGGTIDGGMADRLRSDARRLLRQALAASGLREPLWRRVIARLRARSD